MRDRILTDIIVPAREGRAVELKKGEVLRLYIVEGPQVGDCVFYNARDHREMFHVGQSWALNQFLGCGAGDVRSGRGRDPDVRAGSSQ